MLNSYFKSERTRARYHQSTAGPFLDTFIQWFEKHGYTHRTIRRRIVGAVQFADWSRLAGWSISELDTTALGAFAQALGRQGLLRTSCGDYHVRFLGARHFLRFLQAHGITAARVTTPKEPVQSVLFEDFRHWMLSQRGVAESTLNGYRAIVLDLLTTLGEEPERFTAKGLRDFFVQRIHDHNRASAQNVVSAVRMLLRFLIATGRCEPQLEATIPAVASWRLSTLPRYLPSAEVERVIRACDSGTALGARDRVVILLLARLGLRANEVAGLRFDDIDWHNATLNVRDKCRRRARLPLPQDVGDALLHYLGRFRPSVDSDRVLITIVAPHRPLSRPTITQTAVRALRRSAVDAPFFGAHLFRHSAATTLLNEGASLQTIGVVLRHTSLESTALYAKVDRALLQEVALPWPEVNPC